MSPTAIQERPVRVLEQRPKLRLKLVNEVLTSPRFERGTVYVALNEDVNLTSASLTRNQGLLKTAIEEELIDKSQDVPVIVLTVGDIGLDTAGINFLEALKRKLHGQDKKLIILCDKTSQLELLRSSSALLPIIRDKQIGARRLAEVLHRRTAA